MNVPKREEKRGAAREEILNSQLSVALGSLDTAPVIEIACLLACMQL
jgi:hypothetical protein